MMTKMQKLYWRRVIGIVNRDTQHAQGNGPFVCSSLSTRQYTTIGLRLSRHGRRRSLFSGRALTCRSQSSVWSSRKAIARHTKIRDQNPSLGYICPGEPHQRSPNAPKIEDPSQEETEWQEQGAREAAWKLAKNVFKLKEHERATVFSHSEYRCLPASTSETWGTRICCRLRSVIAHDQQKGPE